MLTTAILIVLAFAFLIIGSLSYFTFIKISKNGIVTDGVIFDTESSTINNVRISYPTVRFLTVNNEWITETSKTGLFPSYYKNGEKVIVIYNPDNPKQFLIKSNYNKVVPFVIIIAGLALLGVGIINLLRI